MFDGFRSVAFFSEFWFTASFYKEGWGLEIWLYTNSDHLVY